MGILDHVQSVSIPARVLGTVESIRVLRDAMDDITFESYDDGRLTRIPLHSFKEAIDWMRSHGYKIVTADSQPLTQGYLDDLKCGSSGADAQ